MPHRDRILSLYRRICAMRIPVWAGNASFFLLLSMFPILSLFLSILPYTPLTLAQLLSLCGQLVPLWMQDAVAYFVRTLYASRSAAVVSLSAVLTLWSASKGMLSLLYGLNAVGERRETRPYLMRRLLCVLHTAAMLLALLLTLGLYAAGQAIQAFLQTRGFGLAVTLESVLRHLHLYSFVLLTAVFAALFLALPDGRRRFVQVLPGAAGAAVSWVVFSEGYSYYVNHIARASALYGSLSVPLLMLLWLYACISILFYGALLNHILFDWENKEGMRTCSDT